MMRPRNLATQKSLVWILSASNAGTKATMPKSLNMFIGEMLRNPAHVGAVAPSSRALARSMTQDLDKLSGQVIEIGPGTGAITREILRAGVPPENLTLFEMNTQFCKALRREFPNITVHNQMAQEMAALNFDEVSAVLSGLPLLNMPTDVQQDILSSVFATLRPGGAFIQFTYGARPPIDRPVRENLTLRWTKYPKVWRNLPPATVYVFTQY